MTELDTHFFIIIYFTYLRTLLGKSTNARTINTAFASNQRSLLQLELQ